MKNDANRTGQAQREWADDIIQWHGKSLHGMSHSVEERWLGNPAGEGGIRHLGIAVQGY